MYTRRAVIEPGLVLVVANFLENRGRNVCFKITRRLAFVNKTAGIYKKNSAKKTELN